MLTRLVPNPRARTAVCAALVFLVGGLLTQLVLPGRPGAAGTPAAVLFNGLVLGALNALTAVGLVLIYRSNRVINFAQTAIGAAGGELTFQLLQSTGTPLAVAFPAGLALAALLGLMFDLVIGRRFAQSPRLVLTVATIACAGLLAGSMRELVQRLPFIPEIRSIDEVLGTASLRDELPFPDFTFTLGSLDVPFGFPELLALAASGLAILGVGMYLRLTRSGVAIRAYAENLERASLLGISTGNLSTIVWVLSALLSGVSVILTGLVSVPGNAVGIAPEILLPALAAAVIARMSSIPVAVAAAVGLQLLKAALAWSYPSDAALVDLLVFAIISGGLLLQQSTIGRSEQGSGVTWEAVREQRPVPRELAQLTGIRLMRGVIVVAALAAVVLYPFLVSTGPLLLGAVIALNGVLALSLVVLTGWAGQVSLGQFGFAAVGGVAAGALSGRVGLTFWLAVPLAAAFTGLFAAAVGIPALRIKGLFLGVTTFAFAIAAYGLLFNDRYLGWALPDDIARPTAPFIDFEDDRAMYYLCVAVLVLAVVVVTNLRRSRVGRLLIAVRENEANLQTMGVSAVKIKLLAFGLSGTLAGLAGAIFVHLQRGISQDSFVPQRSVDLFLLAVLGGVSSVTGVLLGSLYFNVATYFAGGNFIFALIQPFAVILLLFIEPSGVIGLINRVRDEVLRIVAQRRGLVVPSLFADMDPDALAARLIPLAEPFPGSGLDAVGARRFALHSELYGSTGRRLLNGRTTGRPSAESTVIGAVALSVTAEETA